MNCFFAKNWNRVLKIQVSKSHKTESLQTPEKERTLSFQEELSLTPSLGTRDEANLSQSLFSEISSESQDSDICKLICTKCKISGDLLKYPAVPPPIMLKQSDGTHSAAAAGPKQHIVQTQDLTKRYVLLERKLDKLIFSFYSNPFPLMFNKLSISKSWS